MDLENVKLADIKNAVTPPENYMGKDVNIIRAERKAAITDDSNDEIIEDLGVLRNYIVKNNSSVLLTPLWYVVLGIACLVFSLGIGLLFIDLANSLRESLSS